MTRVYCEVICKNRQGKICSLNHITIMKDSTACSGYEGQNAASNTWTLSL